MKVINLKAENVKRLEAIDITPGENGVVTIGGKNGAGKSTVLDAIAMALGGKTLVPEVPIRRGETKATIVIDLGDLVVKRTFTRELLTVDDTPGESAVPIFGPTNSYLTVSTKDGAKYPSPQAVLDKLVGSLTFDPSQFALMDDEREQGRILADLVKFDTSSFDTQISAAFSARTEFNREITRLKGKLDGMKGYPEAGYEPISAAEIGSELEVAEAKRKDAERANLALIAAVGEEKRVARSLETTATLIENLKKELAAAEERWVQTQATLTEVVTESNEARAALDAANNAVPNMTEITKRLTDVEARNSQVKTNVEIRQLTETLGAKQAESDRLTAEIRETEMARDAAIAAIQFPVDGLGLTGGTVTFNDLPFSQASTAEKLRVSVAVGLALNPTLKVMLVRDGSLLDDDNLRLLADLAAKNDAQIWVERVARAGEPVTVMIEEGRMK